MSKRDKLFDLPIYKKAELILDLVNSLLNTISEEDEYLNATKYMMRVDAAIICAKIAGAEGLTMLMQSGLVNYFVFEQLDQNRKKFEKISMEALEKELRSGNYFNDFKTYMAKGGLLFNLDNQKEKVLFYLQAEFVRQLFNENTYYQLILKKDNMVNKVLSK